MGSDVDIRKLLSSKPLHRKIVGAVLSQPYIERQRLATVVNAGERELEAALAELTELMVILELTSQADSSVESRVPKRVYLVNPEFESLLKGIA